MKTGSKNTRKKISVVSESDNILFFGINFKIYFVIVQRTISEKGLIYFQFKKESILKKCGFWNTDRPAIFILVDFT